MLTDCALRTSCSNFVLEKKIKQQSISQLTLRGLPYGLRFFSEYYLFRRLKSTDNINSYDHSDLEQSGHSIFGTPTIRVGAFRKPYLMRSITPIVYRNGVVNNNINNNSKYHRHGLIDGNKRVQIITDLKYGRRAIISVHSPKNKWTLKMYNSRLNCWLVWA